MEELNISKQLFRQLVEQLKRHIAGLYFSETDKWCSIYQKGGKRFAYVWLTKTRPKINVYCSGDFEPIHQKYSSLVKFRLRKETSGGFGNKFQINFIIENLTDIHNAVPLLIEVSESWSRDELISAFNLYCKIPLEEINTHNEKIINFSNLLGKTPKEIVRRFLNFSKLESEDTRGVGEEEKITYTDFSEDWERLVHESEEKVIDFENKLKSITNFPKGKERESIVKSRINQAFFRDAVLTSYQYKCCITGLPFVDLLNASHIVPWSADSENRLNPHNGLCLNALHDRAFDRGLITVRPDYTIDISSHINNFLDYKSVGDYFLCFRNKKIILPQRFAPERSFLEFHNKNVFRK